MSAMSSNHPAISVRGLAKSYSIRKPGWHATLAETLLARLKNPFQKNGQDTFWALKNISFDIEAGDAVGIIGRNGAGKSTLLKLIGQITEPTAGEIDLYGRVGSLLEVGTGFHPELTGRENIFLNGAILGMTRREIQSEFDAIVEFAGITQFLDTPVKRYSSGMYVRLAFAVAAHLRTEILLVDEVLAVGDFEFQKKCLGKMKDVTQVGRTVLFVSHHMQSISVLCNKGIVLEKGGVTYQGDAGSAIEYYMGGLSKSVTELGDPRERSGSGELRVTSITPVKECFECGEEKVIRFTIERFKPYTEKILVSFHVVDERGVIVLHCDSSLVGYRVDVTDTYEGQFTLRTPWLKPARYRLDMYLCNMGIIDKLEGACYIEVLPVLPYEFTGVPGAASAGVVFADFSYDAVANSMNTQPVDATMSR
jgi:lipopolysaccharide transport system ATP-binding protein